jgi:hypothetical protein
VTLRASAPLHEKIPCKKRKWLSRLDSNQN